MPPSISSWHRSLQHFSSFLPSFRPHLRALKDRTGPATQGEAPRERGRHLCTIHESRLQWGLPSHSLPARLSLLCLHPSLPVGECSCRREPPKRQQSPRHTSPRPGLHRMDVTMHLRGGKWKGVGKGCSHETQNNHQEGEFKLPQDLVLNISQSIF